LVIPVPRSLWSTLGSGAHHPAKADRWCGTLSHAGAGRRGTSCALSLIVSGYQPELLSSSTSGAVRPRSGFQSEVQAASLPQVGQTVIN
jgi:hypothetical protein